MRVLGQDLKRCAFGSKERAPPKHPTSESLGGVKEEASREGGGGDGGGGGGGTDGEREKERKTKEG